MDAPFTLDTSGRVFNLNGLLSVREITPPSHLKWEDLTPFAQGYVEALLTGDIEYPDPSEGYGPSCAPKFDWLAPEALATILADCERAQHPDWRYSASDGAWFWRDRQGCKWATCPPLTVSLGDDGKFYLKAVA